MTEIKRYSVTKGNHEIINDERLKYVHTSLKYWWPSNPENRSFALSYKQFFDKAVPLAGLMHSYDNKILTGTDYNNPYCLRGFGPHDELKHMVSAGLSPAEALKTATINPALFMKKTREFDSVEIGKKANLVLLKDNPPEEIRNTTKIAGIFFRGQFIPESELELMIKEAERKASGPFMEVKDCDDPSAILRKFRSLQEIG